MTCDARIRPLPNGTEIWCHRDGEHTTHSGMLRDYSYPGSGTVVEWNEDDRRTFHGEYPGLCDTTNCTLPAGHPRDHNIEQP